jgi:outer membrane lipoprotein-sorting protein
MKSWLMAFATLTVLLTSGCGGSSGSAPAASASPTPTDAPASASSARAPVSFASQDYAEALAKWQAAGVSDYEFAYKEGGDGYKFANYPYLQVTIENGQVVRVMDGDQALNPEDYAHLTVEGLFGRIAQVYAQVPQVAADYDPLLGYPESLITQPGCCDGSTRMEIRNFTLRN